ncbi:eukaryotic translation initiation factor 4 gamma 2 [Eupeodes corollae]|uniref:eukaryotic translation initiation factor 4 gamma 2 n=1 Tax=Eupeodes corollae TaxID=290404 RepID=UPI0024938352|nr:eukaryotic translation initiation factor 4 gamma 2 [Eupeodes corollae]
MYAQLCKRLSKEAPNFEENSTDKCTFLRLLLAICRDSFNNRLKPTEIINDSNNATGNTSTTNNNESTEKHQLTQEEEEKRHLAKQRMLGNVKFIGELNKLEMLSKKILHQCILHLLDKKKKRTTTQQEMCEDMECLSQLLRTCGKNLDNTEQGKDMMNSYFERLERRSISTEYPPRIRFMLKDVIELRANNWVPRKVATTEGPVPIKQIRTDDDTPIRTPYANRNRDMRNNDRDNDNWMNRFPLNLQPGFNDMFGSLSVSGSSPIMSPGYNNNRQYNNQRNNQNNHHNNYNNRYNKHNNGQHNNNGGGQHNNNMHNNQSSQYNQMLNNKELAPRFKSKLMSANQDAVENLQMRPAANSLLFKVAVQNSKQPPLLPMSTHPPQSGGGNGQQTGNSSASSSTSQLSANHYPLLATPASLNQNRPSSTPSSEYQYSTDAESSKPTATISATEKVLKSIASSPNFSTAASGSNDDISAQSGSQSNKKTSSDSGENNNTQNNKQGTSEKNSSGAGQAGGKQAKKDKAFNKDEVLKRTSAFFKENFYTNDKETSAVVEEFVQLKVPEKCMKDVCINLVMDVLDKSDQYFDKLIEFLQSLRKQSLIKANVVLEVFKQVVNRMNEREVIIPRIATLVACLLSKAVASANLLKLTEVAAFTENGQHYPLFLLVLQQLHKSLGRDTLEEMFRASKIDLMKSLPEADRNKTRLAEILDDRSLAFLYPLLKVQAEMLKQLQTDSNPQAFYKWIKTTVDAKYYKDPGFVTALMTVILKYITEETNLASSAETKRNPEKSMIEKEQVLLHKYCQILETFLNGNIDLQLIALYALQMFCYNANFPKGMLCRWFKNLYEASVIEEEAFLLWKEEISDKYPGKGTALFQVNNWLTWLEEAESEDEED